MPRGAAVIPYHGKRGTTWRIKYADASGKQVMQTIGAERDGVTEKLAQEALADRLSDVRRKAYSRPKPITFAAYCDLWFAEGEKRRRWRRRTVIQYRSIAKRLKDHFGSMTLGSIRSR